jgi:hypothetical protein
VMREARVSRETSEADLNSDTPASVAASTDGHGSAQAPAASLTVAAAADPMLPCSTKMAR